MKKITAFGHFSRGGNIVSLLQPGDPGDSALDPWFCVTAFRRICPLKPVISYKFTIVLLFCQYSGRKRGHAGYKIQDAGYKIQDAGYKIQDAGYKIQDAGYKIQDAGCKMQDSGGGLQDAGITVAV